MKTFKEQMKLQEGNNLALKAKRESYQKKKKVALSLILRLKKAIPVNRKSILADVDFDMLKTIASLLDIPYCDYGMLKRKNRGVIVSLIVNAVRKRQ